MENVKSVGQKVAFGTSGVRGLVTEMTDVVCYHFTAAFLMYLQETQQWQKGQQVLIGGDLRSSTVRIVGACMQACRDLGGEVVYAGLTPSPAVARYGFANGIPSLMVTGSHIPDDRNGIKFNTPTGEILKADESGITRQIVKIPYQLFDSNEMLVHAEPLPDVNVNVEAEYVRRYVDFFGLALKGMRVGVYQHSSVGRDVIVQVLTSLGAQVTSLGRSERFIPVDTEAIRIEDVALAKEWASSAAFDSIVSADGDADRPLLSDENGQWLRGDILGVLCARFLGCLDVVTPVSSNTAVEKSGWFDSVSRTKIGSPYVIEGMSKL